MWALSNSTPYAADRCMVVDKNGEKHYVVVVKGTFDIRPNSELVPAEVQLEPVAEPEYLGDPGESSLVYEQDLIAAKPRTDIYLNASAHAPNGRPTTRVTVGLSTPVGTKSLVVQGDRRWERNLMGLVEPGPATPFVTMPIVYERAYGGYDRTDPDKSAHRMDPSNPVGTGFFTKAAHRVGKLMPNVEFLDGDHDRGPAGYGAICSYWQPRMAFQGTYDAKWIESRKPLLPQDYDPQWLQCAPRDQQVAPHMRGGEPLGVVGMTPSGTLRFEVPKHYFAFTTHIGRKTLEHRAQINTVIIEPDHPRVIVVWHSMLSCHHDIDNIDFTEIREKPYI